jgi:Golgi nucleoside diphosphatase
MKKYQTWQLTRINNEWKMSYANIKTQEIEIRNLYWWEHFKYFWKTLCHGVLNA